MSALEDVACRSYVDSITQYVEGELDQDRATALEQHAVVCRGCSRYLDQTRTVVRLLSGRAPAAVTAFTGRTPVAAGKRAYKFVGLGRVGPFSGFAWPVGEWVSAPGLPAPCRRGVHACAVDDLPYWLGRELWVVELAEPLVRARDKFVAAAGRLEQRVAEWDEKRSLAFAQDCADRTRALAVEALRETGGGPLADAVARAANAEVRALLAKTAAAAGEARPACEYAASAFESLEDEPFEAGVGAAYAAALAAAHRGGADARRAERAAQAAWLRETLRLRDDLPLEHAAH